MTPHWHASIDNVLLYGVSAIIVFNVVKLASAQLVKRGGALGELGASIGALVA